MPTPAPDGPATAADLHRERQLAESFGVDPARYDRARPDYPDELVRAVVAAAPGPDVLDVGCGTGIASRQFRAAGCRVLGVEVDRRMAEHARADGFAVEVARFEDWDPAGRVFDAVVAGQTWHWVDDVAGAARAAAVLCPGGLLAVFWNVARLPAEIAAGTAEVYRRILPDLPFHRAPADLLEGYAAMQDAAADGMHAAGGFAQPQRWRFDRKRTYRRDEWLDQLPTLGGHSRFPAEVLAALADGIGEAIDRVGGRFEVDYATVAVVAARTAR